MSNNAPASHKLLFAQTLEELERRGIDVDLIVEDQGQLMGPQTPDELWDAIYELTGYKIPKNAVCEGHVAPFEIFADVYFEKRSDVLMIGNRGGGKTTLSGFLHGAKGKWKPNYKTAIAGAVERQSDRAYAEFKRFTQYLAGEIVDSLMKKTIWTNGSETEVLAGTVKAVNGPHPHFAQFDELELTTAEVFEEWQNMSQGDANYAGQNLLSSTRKRMYGLVQAIVKECEDASRNGDAAPWDVMTFCVFETMAQVPDCGKKDKNGDLLCGCDKVVKGKWADGTERTFASVCNGRAAKADGFINLKDVHRRFKGLGRKTWEAQQECLRPSSEGLVHAWWDPDLYEIQAWYPRPEYGPVYRSWDWGGTNPHAVLWHQILKVPVVLHTDNGDLELPEGAIVTFDEVYHPGGGFYNLGLEVMERTAEWHSHGYEFDIEFDFCDPAGASAKEDVKKAASDAGYPLPQWRMIPATIESSVEKHIEIGEDGLLYVVGSMCKNLVEEYESYHWPETKPGQPPPKRPVLVDDHAVDSMRYCLWNLYKLSAHRADGEAPVADVDSAHPAMNRSRELHRNDMLTAHETAESIMSPGYARGDYEVDRPTIRRMTRSVRRG